MLTSPIDTKRALDTTRALARFATALPKIAPNAKISPYTILNRWAENMPEELAIAFEDERYTWRQTRDRAGRFAAWFSNNGVGRGDVVAVMMNNRPDYLFAVMGLNQIGAVAALINTNLSGPPFTHAVNIAEAKKVLVGSEYTDRVDEVSSDLTAIDKQDDVWVLSENASAPSNDPRTVTDERLNSAGAPRNHDNPRNSDLFCYIYTSGTTGLPKAAIIRSQRILSAALLFGHVLHRSRPGDLIYIALPLYHSNAMMLGWGAALVTGASLGLRTKFSASNFFADIRKFGATSFVYIGELCRYLLNTPVQAGESNHRLKTAIGNGLRPDIWEEFQTRFGIPVIREFYGSTEGNAPTVNISGKPGMIGKLSVGQAIIRCDAESGEPLRNSDGFCERCIPGETGLFVGKISKVSAFDGYVDKDATNKKILTDVFQRGDRYFNTGDLIDLHEGKWLSFADRIGDTFRWKGENVSTNEVAQELSRVGGVVEANVYGVEVPGADGKAGMAALAVDESFDLETFGRFCAESLPHYQKPLFVRLLSDGMRITGTFKQQKVEYRREGFDPSRTSDPLYALVDGRYQTIDANFYDKIQDGSIKLG